MGKRIALLLVVLILGAGLLEGAARWVCRTDEARRERLLSGDDYWLDRWLAAESTTPGAPEPGRRPDRATHAPLARDDSIHRHDPRLGWAPRESVRQDGLTTNSLGMRGSAEVAIDKPRGERRIVVIGDSFTFGDGVKDEEVYTFLLEQRLAQDGRHKNVKVLNLGVMGYGTDQQCLRLEELGMRLEPDVVICGLFGPDLDRNELAFRDAPKPRFVPDGKGLKLANVPVPTIDDLRGRSVRASVPSYAVAMLSRILDARSAEDEDAPKWELGRRILERMHAVAQFGEAKLVIAYFPAKPSSFAANPDAYERVVVEWANHHGVPIINVRDAFVRLGSNRFRDVWQNHWTPFGHRTVADAIHDGLREFGVLAAE